MCTPKQLSVHLCELLGLIGMEVEVRVDRQIGSAHPEYPGTIYHVNYGYVPGTKAPDGREIDAYVLGITRPIDAVQGTCIAVIHRLNDVESKLVIAPQGMQFSDAEIRHATAFQERYFEARIRRGYKPRSGDCLT